MTKLYVSVDTEGVAGVVHWDQIMLGAPDYAVGRRLLMGELNSLCRGARAAGATEMAINDAHSQMRNIVPDELDEHTSLITGHFKPNYMMEGLDPSFDAAVFLGYHGPIGSSSVLSHSYSPRVIWEARIDGRVTGETGINALVAHHHGVPVVMITGDDLTIQDAGHWIPEARGIVVKHSVSRFAAESVSPERSRDLIYQGIQQALSELPGKQVQSRQSTELELTLQSDDMARLAEWAGAERVGDRKVRLVDGDALALYRKFHMLLLLARAVVDS